MRLKFFICLCLLFRVKGSIFDSLKKKEKNDKYKEYHYLLDNNPALKIHGLNESYKNAPVPNTHEQQYQKINPNPTKASDQFLNVEHNMEKHVEPHLNNIKEQNLPPELRQNQMQNFQNNHLPSPLDAKLPSSPQQ